MLLPGKEEVVESDKYKFLESLKERGKLMGVSRGGYFTKTNRINIAN